MQSCVLDSFDDLPIGPRPIKWYQSVQRNFYIRLPKCDRPRNKVLIHFVQHKVPWWVYEETPWKDREDRGGENILKVSKMTWPLQVYVARISQNRAAIATTAVRRGPGKSYTNSIVPVVYCSASVIVR